MGKFIDLTGQTFGRLTVIDRVEGTLSDIRWTCLCSCGTTKVIRKSSLSSGRAVSCGCFRKEFSRASLKTHGESGTPLHMVWKGMKARCENPNSPSYKNYGARGITVCDRWQSFENFSEDMGDSLGLTIERIDNSLGYSPENCRWATRTEQANNMRSNRLLAFAGESRTVAQWATHLGVRYDFLYARLKLGWTVERTLTQPARKSPTKRNVSDQPLVIV